MANILYERCTDCVQFIRQSNSEFPLYGDNACHMVSKFVTNVNLSGNDLSFDGPPGSPADPDTFRVQARGLPTGQSPTARVEVIRPDGTVTFTQNYSMIEGTGAQVRVYRSRRHVRLVSNAVDDGHLNGPPDQTPLVQLGDLVRATVLLDNTPIGFVTLPVGRPPAEDGINAIRTVDVHFVTLQGTNSNPSATILRMNRNWAQVGIKFNLVLAETLAPVRNVLTVEQDADQAGQISADVIDPTPDPPVTRQIVVAIANGDTAEQIAGKIATAISAHAEFTATAFQHGGSPSFDGYIVLVNKGTNVDFANLQNSVPSVTVERPGLDFTDTINLLEGSVLALNLRDEDTKSVEIISVGQVSMRLHPTSSLLVAATGGNYLAAYLSGWQNACIIREEAVSVDGGNYPFAAGHEMGHALFDGGDDIHSQITTNLFKSPGSTSDDINATKRLNDTISGVIQQDRARQASGPNTNPGLLQKK